MSDFKNACSICLNIPTSAQSFLLLNPNVEKKLDFIHGLLKNKNRHQVSKYICVECETELEFVHKFFAKLKSSNFRNEHADVADEERNIERNIHAVVKTEVAESEKEPYKLEHQYDELESEFIPEAKIVEVPKLEDPNVDEDNIQTTPIKSNDNQKKRKRKLPKELNINVCDICNKSFNYRSNLLRHLKEHQGKRFVCGYENCNLIFSQKTSLKVHMVVHTGEKPFLCNVCNKKFTQRKSLVIHSKIHKNERSYECDRCKRSFIQRENFKRHLKVPCKVDRSTNFQCINCKNYFASKQSLQRHYKLHEHKNEDN